MQTNTGIPLYQVIVNDLRARIANGNFSYDAPFCTEKKLSDQYGVSRITAQKAISLLEEEGILFRKRGVGSFVLRQDGEGEVRHINITTQKTVALVIPFGLSKGGIFRAIEAATLEMAHVDCFFTLHVCDDDESQRSTLLSLADSNISGIVYYPSADIDTQVLDRFVEQGKRVIIIDKPFHYPHYSNISCDNVMGSVMLTEHLLSYGHRKIAYLSRFSDRVSSVRNRFIGYVDTLEASGLDIMPYFAKLDIEGTGPLNYQMLKYVINTLYNEGYTAIMCENDEVAFYTHMCCDSLSIRVPEDLSITGFDNIEWAVTGSAQITTVDQNFEQIGKEIAELITSEAYEARQSKVSVKLVPRTSTGPAARQTI